MPRALAPMARVTFVLFSAVGCAAAPSAPPETAEAAPRFAGPKLERAASAAFSPRGAESPELAVMAEELATAMAALATQPEGAPYFVSYLLSDVDSTLIGAEQGAIETSYEKRYRVLDVDLRVGSPALDNTHPVRGFGGGTVDHQSYRVEVPLSADPTALRTALWSETDVSYKRALERLAQVKAERAIKVDEEDQSGDFSPQAKVTLITPEVRSAIDRGAWEARLRKLSAVFREYPVVYHSNVSLQHEVTTRFLVNTEGSKAQTSSARLVLTVSAGTVADDGMELSLLETFSAFAEAGLPSDAAVEAAIRKLCEQVIALRTAPLAEPYFGPAILEGHAASVFFHEVFGHRIEGHRQGDESEGQTFAKKIGKSVMPELIHVFDDPTSRTLGGAELMGHYAIDEEGVPAERVDLVKGGVLQTFLMSRDPTRGIERSNGHGRAMPGASAVARQGNLIVQPTHALPVERLRARLIEEIERAKKPYGLLFRKVSGGYTLTQRAGPQAFKVEPLLVLRIYPDGREELIRGVDLEGTPLTVLSKIEAAGDDYSVFNGICGAESGWVPVSAASPSLLVSQVEVARKDKSQERPPVLPPPAASATPGGTP